MNKQHYLCRLPFRSADGSPRYRVMGELTDDADVDFQVPIESLTDMRKLPFCADCLVGQNFSMVRGHGNVCSVAPYIL